MNSGCSMISRVFTLTNGDDAFFSNLKKFAVSSKSFNPRPQWCLLQKRALSSHCLRVRREHADLRLENN
jgi:hypothetical protein